IDYTSPKLELESYSNSKNNKTQKLNASQPLLRFERFYFMHYSRSNPIAWDPSTNAVGIAINERQFLPGAFYGSKLYMLRTTDAGQSWDSVHVYRNPDIGPFYPSLAFLNADKSSNIEDLSYVMYAPQTTEKTNGTWANGSGGTFSIYDKSIGENPEPIDQDAPTTGFPPDNQHWGNLLLNSNDVTNSIYGYGTLDPVTENDQFGYYGYWGFNFETQAITSNIPKEWWANQFRDPGSKTSSWNGQMVVTNDDQGTLFAGVNNRHFENAEPRLLGISKSTDGGDNWSKFELMPELTLNSILNNHPGYTTVGITNPYSGNAMFSRGTDKVSFLAEVIITGTDLPALAFITELKYDNGLFSLTEIAELETTGPFVTLEHSSTRDDTTQWAIRYQASTYGNNLQVAKTADGDKLVLMYIDAVKDSGFPLESPVQVYLDVRDPLTNDIVEQQDVLDSILQYDIFSVVYDMNTGEWGDPVNITNDRNVETLFNIPSVIPDVENVPILTYETTETSFRLNKFNFPNAIKEMLIDWGTVLKYTHNLDATSSQGPLNSVKESLDFKVELGNAYPNPAVNTDNVEISFSVEKLSTVSLSLYDNLGNKVSTILNESLIQADNKTLNANISNLNSGTYYYQL
ncbi:MAG: T9SS type A sorting domain-containing protein, partial [Candidatus Kapaibacterium sp.]